MTKTEELRVRFDALRASGQLRDLKVWYVPNDAPATLEDLSAELLDILDCVRDERYLDISDKIR